MHRDEPGLSALKEQAIAHGELLEVVVGSAPGWADPWSRGILAQVIQGPNRWELWLYDTDGFAIRDEDVQAARRLDVVEEPVALLH